MTSLAFREVRRLAMLREVARVMVVTRGGDEDLVAAQLIGGARLLNEQLRRYARKTGRVSTVDVAKRHLLVGAQLGLLEYEGHFTKPTPRGTVVALISSGNVALKLSLSERIVFLEVLLGSAPCPAEVSAILRLLARKHLCTFSDITGVLSSDRVAKSHVEWLVDLGLLESTLPARGEFRLAQTAEDLLPFVDDRGVGESFIREYSRKVSGVRRAYLDERALLRVFEGALSDLRSATRSPVDASMYAARPVIEMSRFRLLSDGYYLGFRVLLERLIGIGPKAGYVIKWDEHYDNGVIREAR